MNALSPVTLPDDARSRPSMPSLDSGLLHLEKAFVAAWAHENEEWAVFEDQNADDDSPLHIAAQGANAETSSIVDRISKRPAHTLDGLLVKMRAVSWCRTGEPIDENIFLFSAGKELSTDQRLMLGVLQDLAAMVGRAPA